MDLLWELWEGLLMDLLLVLRERFVDGAVVGVEGVNR